MSEEVLDFGNLDLKEVPVKVDGVEYLLREANGGAVITYRNKLHFEMSKRDQGTVTDKTGIADLEPLLVSLCLVDAENKKFVPQATIRGWPNRIQKALYNKAREISGMNEAGEEAAKN